MDSSQNSIRSLKAYWLYKLCPNTIWASSCASIMARLSLIRQHVNQPSTDHDRITHAERLERGCKQHAYPHRRRQIDIVRELQVVDYGLQDLVYISLRGHQSGSLQALQYVIRGLFLPLALGLKGDASWAVGFRPSRSSPPAPA